MIYLIDDKKIRQADYGWSEVKLKQYKEDIRTVYTLNEMSDISFRKKMFSKGNVLFIHESFFNNPLNSIEGRQFEEIRESISEYATKNESALVLFFSGSIQIRKKDGAISYMPVSTFYQNLEFFIKEFKGGNTDLRYLFFGKNPEIENALNRKLIEANNTIEDTKNYVSDKQNLFLRPPINFIQNPNISSDIKILYKSENSYLVEKITNWLTLNKYHNIFIPLCFGQTLSDFNGLRLATLIRCTKSINQLSTIFIYSFTGLEDFFENDYLNILKTKNVELVEYKKTAFKEAILKQREQLKENELSAELNKLNLKVPSSYFDSHHIANEWGIYQMARNANLNINEIEGFDKEKLNSIYFKWLITKNELNKKLPETQIKEQKRYADVLSKPKTVGKIDLDKIPRK